MSVGHALYFIVFLHILRSESVTVYDDLFSLLSRALMEAQDIFGLDFDPAELEKLAREGLPSDDEEGEEEEEDQYNVCKESLSLSLSFSLSFSLSLSPFSPTSTCDDELCSGF